MNTKLKKLLFIIMILSLFQFSFPLFAEEKIEAQKQPILAHFQADIPYFRIRLMNQKANVQLFFTENIPLALKDGELNIQIITTVSKRNYDDNGNYTLTDIVTKDVPIGGQPRIITNDAIEIKSIEQYEKGIKLHVHRKNNQPASLSINNLIIGPVDISPYPNNATIKLSGSALGDYNNTSIIMPNFLELSGPSHCYNYVVLSINSNKVKEMEVVCLSTELVAEYTISSSPYRDTHGNIMVPACNALEGKKVFDTNNKRLIINQGSRRLIFTAGSNKLQEEWCFIVDGQPRYVKGEDIILSTLVVITNDRMYINAEDVNLIGFTKFRSKSVFSFVNEHELRFYMH